MILGLHFRNLYSGAAPNVSQSGLILRHYLASLDRGVLYMLTASFLFAIMGAFAKLASESMSSLEVVFFRNLFGVLIIGAAVWRTPMRHEGGKPLLLLFRGLMGFAALLAFFYNIAHIPLGDAMTFSKTSPIFTAIFAWIFLNEKLSAKGWAAVVVGFVGIVLITKPSGALLGKTDLLGIASGIGAALAYTSVRELKRYYDTRAIVLSFMGVGTAGPLLLMLVSPYVEAEALDFMFGSFVMPDGIVWLYVLGMGLFATLAQLYMTKAYGESQAGIVGAVSYTNIVFAIFVGLMLGDTLPDLLTLSGIILIVFSGVMVARKK